jgi:diguanylate cyclase (GGDEF)-like protein
MSAASVSRAATSGVGRAALAEVLRCTLAEVVARVAEARASSDGCPESHGAALRGCRALVVAAREDSFPLVVVQAARLALLLEGVPSGWGTNVDAAIASTAWEIEHAARERPSTIAIAEGTGPEGAGNGIVLVVEDRARALVDAVAAQLATPIAVEDVDEALVEARRRRPDAIFVDEDHVGSAEVLRLAHELRRIPGAGAVPLAIVSSEGWAVRRAAVAHAGASLYLEKPVTSEALGLSLRRLLEGVHASEAKVLVIDDDPDDLSIAERLLVREGFVVRTLDDPRRVLEVLEEIHPDLVVVDASMPELDGYDVCRILRTSAEWQDLPILFVTGRSDREAQLAAFRAGADDFVLKGAPEDELTARIRGRIERTRSLRERSERDALTGLQRRGPFMAQLLGLVNQARRRSRPLALALLDLDRFKEINDRHGHLAGDRVLVALGKLLSTRFRAEDLRGRWGGEEFVLAFPDSDGASVHGALLRLLEDLRALPFEGEGGATFRATFSAGIGTFPVDGRTPADLFATADRRMYVAKRLGRARVVSDG